VQLFFELHQELVDHAHDDVAAERGKRNDRIEPVAEFGREHALDFGHLVTRLPAYRKADRSLRQLRGTGVGGHDDHHIAEIRLASVVVGQRAVIHHLQQDVVDIRMRLLDLVEQQHRIWMLGDRFGQQPALVETDVAGRRADQPRNRMAFHVFRHVEADQFDAHDVGKLARDFGLATPVGPLKRKHPVGFCGLPRPLRAILIAADSASIACSWTEHHRLQVAVEILQLRAIVGGHALRRDARDLGDDLLDLCLVMTFFCFDFGRMRCAAPASSITSIALSGRWRSLM